MKWKSPLLEMSQSSRVSQLPYGAVVSNTFLYMLEFSYYILFGAVETEEIPLQTYFQEHKIQY